MQQTIYKYPIPVDGILELPKGARILSVGVQDSVPTLWAQVDRYTRDDEANNHIIEVYGTGHQIEEAGNLEFIGAAFDHRLGLVWHIFERLA